MNKEIENLEEQTNILFKIANKLEQRISTLEKVLASHAKCIGELRGTELRIHDLKELSELTPDEFAKQVRFNSWNTFRTYNSWFIDNVRWTCIND